MKNYSKKLFFWLKDNIVVNLTARRCSEMWGDRKDQESGSILDTIQQRKHRLGTS